MGMLSRDVPQLGLVRADFRAIHDFSSNAPLAGDESSPTPKERASTAGDSQRAILVVEDDPISRRILSQLLRTSGYGTLATETAEEALRRLGEGWKPGFALIDLDLPGINGMELIRRLQEIAPTVVPILVTAASEEKIHAALGGWPVRYIRKPVDFKRLLGLLDGLRAEALAAHAENTGSSRGGTPPGSLQN